MEEAKTGLLNSYGTKLKALETHFHRIQGSEAKRT